MSYPLSSDNMGIESRRVCLSIVNHCHGDVFLTLLEDLRSICKKDVEIIVTNNIPDPAFDQSLFDDLPLKVVNNVRQKGFGDNHNSAFNISNSEFFVIVNPDIRISSLDFDDLLAPFQDVSVAAVAPIVLSPSGGIEDSARKFPSLLRFAKRILFASREPDYRIQADPFAVDWVAGMFVVFRKHAFRQVCGFDSSRFYMYMEDVDICRRIGMNDWKVLINPHVKVIHAAQRASRRNLKHMQWHLISAMRYLTGF